MKLKVCAYSRREEEKQEVEVACCRLEIRDFENGEKPSSSRSHFVAILMTHAYDTGEKIVRLENKNEDRIELRVD